MTAAAPLTLAYIGIGGNLGDALATVNQAIVQLGQLPQTTLQGQSQRYRSAPIDSSGDDYVNAVVAVATALSAHALLAALQAIEQQHGRQRPYHNAPRTLDLDVLLYGDHSINDATLSVPHPRMTQRAFVLLPLLEIAPAIDIPGFGPAQHALAAVTGQTIEIIQSTAH
ncbi:2-amino-4-hydroxy-6-hydroxymethyldihydropteridine diphosphokinase [Herbaspirillum sp. Sphag1AN]|uniref:2-amino-4-hydroxy-6- hydroxymethyldihydropteridine diphosphokinase n=1 Tax=unclassified Herbaspirillum TaxID=2624150 RepID=UPI00161D0815|nr:MULTISPECIES: 2-amino-4-hydroxy-6-hydroxymethyldihydropteridine diphosphokinase [unclassified Herbaspirillum]MBB3212849.1 2-amino-4-hydroxy-6-hydroxymethyldihydropteridine diphosphokinase [Herbaspirillum sp. Sphag1AN]MBB3246046.1 2-amino-4-hydroxy-6-hydroxymethyldihydropteridine diphosphokinase [Herbaspirillum sp. Sphag64]